MNEFNHLPDYIRIKYSIKGDNYFRLYSCAKKDLTFYNLCRLIENDDKTYLVKMYISSSCLEEEKVITSNEEFVDLIYSKSFNSYYYSKYNCLKIQFCKEIKNNSVNEMNDEKHNDLINDKNSIITLDHLFEDFISNNLAKKDLFLFLPENYDKLLKLILNNIKENFENFIASKSSQYKLNLEVSITNIEETYNDKSDQLNFSNMYNINEMNLIPNEEIIRDYTVFRTKKYPNDN